MSSNLFDLRRRLAAASPGGVRKCTSSAEQECRERANDDVATALEHGGLSQREWARLCNRDESIIREWLTTGRKNLPLWSVYRLSAPALSRLIEALLAHLERIQRGSLPPTGTE